MLILGTRGLSILIGMALSVLLARWLGAADFGTYFFTITLANFLAMPVMAGLPTLVVREIAIARSSGDGGLVSGIVRWSVRFVLISSLAVGVIGGLTYWLTGWASEIRPFYFLALPLIVALGTMQLASAVLQGFEKPVLGNLPDGLMRPAILLFLASLAAVVGLLTPGITVAFHIAAAVLAAGWAVIVGRKIRRLPELALPSALPRYHTKAWLLGLLPLTLITGAALLNNRLDVMMLAYFTDTAEVGRYGIAMQIATLVVVGQTIVNNIVQPQIARQFSAGEMDKLQSNISQAARLATALAALVLLALAVFGKPVVLALVGEDFRAAIPVLLVLATGRVLNCLMGPVGVTLNMTGNAYQTAWLTLTFSLVNGALNVALIPQYGAVGAAFATSISLFCLHVAMVLRARRIVGVDTTIFGHRPPS